MRRLLAGVALVLLLVPHACDTAQVAHAAVGGILKVAFLDIGQGDAIYIEAPNGAQMVIDGGPPGALAAPLSSAMPFGDRSINTLVVTNPDADHFAGFLDLFGEYHIGIVIESGTVSLTSTHKELQQKIADAGIPEIMARRGMTITLDPDAGVVFTVLFPDRDVSAWTTNDGSIEGILQYGTTNIMFTGDGTKKTEGIILAENPPADLASDILKVPHHGSTTGSSTEFVHAVGAKYAVISAGKHNKYGLPKQATLDTLTAGGAEIFRTDKEGTITFLSDGERMWQDK